MTDETLEATRIVIPVLAFVLLIFWAENRREWLVYLLAAIFGGYLTIAWWAELETFRFAVAATTILIVLRGYVTYIEQMKSKE